MKTHLHKHVNFLFLGGRGGVLKIDINNVSKLIYAFYKIRALTYQILIINPQLFTAMVYLLHLYHLE